MSQPGFAKDSYTLALMGGRALTLEPPDGVSADVVAEAMCRIDPWHTLKTRPEHLSAFLMREDAHCCRKIVRFDGGIAGAVAVRSPWLYGPYLSLLVVLPALQHLGIGSAMLSWMADEAGAGANNLWVCVSAFNGRAIKFYERHGFSRVGDIPDLVSAGFSELLLRKRLGAIDAPQWSAAGAPASSSTDA